jgi:predicted NBD/HSP70 family sugar kinase
LIISYYGNKSMGEKKTASSEIKRINRTSIYQLLHNNDKLSKQDIVMRLGLSLPTVTQNLCTLNAEGLVTESGSLGNTGGRKARTYSIVKNARTAIGLDITKNHIAVVAVDLSGKVVALVRTRWVFSQTDDYFKKLGSMVDQIIKEADLDRERILGVGIGVPGLISADCNRVYYGKILDFTGATITEFAKYIPFHCSFYNDASAAGFAEIWADKAISNSFYVMLSNNIGGAILIDNHVYPGENLRSGEVGHITIKPKGKTCYCGQKGCVDPYCAATVLSSMTDGNLGQFFALLKSGDKNAKKVWNEYLDCLALAVNNLRMLFDCRIILGGYVGAYMEDYVDELKARASARNFFEDNADYLIVCRYKTEAIAAGSALNYIADFIHSI